MNFLCALALSPTPITCAAHRPSLVEDQHSRPTIEFDRKAQLSEIVANTRCMASRYAPLILLASWRVTKLGDTLMQVLCLQFIIAVLCLDPDYVSAGSECTDRAPLVITRVDGVVPGLAGSNSVYGALRINLLVANVLRHDCTSCSESAYPYFSPSFVI